MREYPESRRLLARALAVTPAGAQTRSKAALMFPEAYPALLDRGWGCRVRDVDGHGYVDWIMGLGAIGLGYCDANVDAAVIDQVRRGASFSLPTTLEAEVAELLCETIPCAEMARFVKGGSEATEAAMRIARLATRRDVILSIGYHGWHSVHDAAHADRPGVPSTFSDCIRGVPYDDLITLGEIAGDWSRVAAVIVEPVLFEPPSVGYLGMLRALCDLYGAVLIFDEIVTGFRWALGGAQEYFGVTPDLATFGKALANGYPLAAVVGRRALMEQSATRVSATFGGEAVSLAAARATIEAYRRRPVIAAIWEAGTRFQAGFRDLAGSLPFEVRGYPCKPKLVCTAEDPEAARVLLSLFLQETAQRGALFHVAGLSVSWAHDGEAVARSLEACAEALEVCAAPGDPRARLRGRPYVESFRRAADAGHGG